MSIGLRFSLLLIAAVAACTALFGLYAERERRGELIADALTEAADLGITLDVVLNDLMADRELRDLAHLPDQIVRAERVYGLAIYGADGGDLIASREMSEHRPQLRRLAERVVRAGHSVSSEDWLDGTHVGIHAFPLRRAGGVVGTGVVVRDLGYIEPHVRNSRRRTTEVGVVLGALVVAVVIAASRQTLARPVSTLIAGVRRIGEGNLSERIEVTRTDEIGRIASALNQLMADLTLAREQIRHELAERIALERSVEIERRMQHAQRLAAVGQIAASIAHEIGSPLHVIAGRARFAAGRDDVNEMRDNLTVIATQADRITGVVEQLLSVARKRSPKVRPVVLAEVARAVVALVGPQAKQQSVALTLELRAPEARATGDADALQQVVFNLVLNAIQAQPRGGEVAVVVDAVHERDSLGSSRAVSVIEVRDRGPGVPSEQRESVFEPFVSARAGGGGTGLGLSVVRGIVRDHAGTIRIADHPGGGAVFRVSLPSHED